MMEHENQSLIFILVTMESHKYGVYIVYYTILQHQLLLQFYVRVFIFNKTIFPIHTAGSLVRTAVNPNQNAEYSITI